MGLTYAPQESRGSQVTPDPRDQVVLRARPAFKDLWDHEETKVTMANQETKASQVSRDLQGPRAQWDHKDPKVKLVLKEIKAFLAPWALRGHCKVTGNSAFLKDSTKEKTLD